MPGRLAAILKRFPRRSVEIEKEIMKNPDFRALCEDYGDAVDALGRWSTSTDESSNRAKEYRQLVRDLELEIQNHVQMLLDN
jgi:hypothetical protein